MVLTGFGHMPQQLLKEATRGKRAQLALAITVIAIAKSHRALVAVHDPRIGNRASAHVARQILRHAPAMPVTTLDADIPFLGGRAPQHGLNRVAGIGARRGQAMLVHGHREVRQQLAAIDGLDHCRRQQVIARHASPLAIRRHAAGSHQAVNVGMLIERSPPCMQRHDDARAGAEMAFLAEQLQQGVANRIEQDARERSSVVTPQTQQFVGHGEDRMKMIAEQQPRLLLVQPLVLGLLRARRATSMLARVILRAHEVTVGTALLMPAHRRRSTRQDRLRGTLLWRRELAALAHFIEVLHEHVLYRRLPCHCMAPLADPPAAFVTSQATHHCRSLQNFLPAAQRLCATVTRKNST